MGGGEKKVFIYKLNLCFDTYFIVLSEHEVLVIIFTIFSVDQIKHQFKYSDNS